jgi:glutamate synthase domain-containing protein 3
MKIDATGVHYRDLNERVRQGAAAGEKDVIIQNTEGQRYIGAGLGAGVRVSIDGIPGNDLAAFMDGADVVVHGNAQDGVANTMNAGTIVVEGDAGDILGHSMRGGRIFVKGRVGYRSGIHMKAYGSRFPVVVIGGKTGHYLGEYMAGGVIVVLGLGVEAGQSPVGEYVGTGMHGGTIFIRGKVEAFQVGREVGMEKLSDADWKFVSELIEEFRSRTGADGYALGRGDFIKLYPRSARPYGTLYAY